MSVSVITGMTVSHAKVVGCLVPGRNIKRKTEDKFSRKLLMLSSPSPPVYRGGRVERQVKSGQTESDWKGQMWQRGMCHLHIRLNTHQKFDLLFKSFLQIDMSKCMVSFIDWYLLRINASEREKIKVRACTVPWYLLIILEILVGISNAIWY